MGRPRSQRDRGGARDRRHGLRGRGAEGLGARLGREVPRLHRPLPSRRPNPAGGAARPDALLAGLLGDQAWSTGPSTSTGWPGDGGMPAAIRATCSSTSTGWSGASSPRSPHLEERRAILEEVLRLRGPLPRERVRAALPRRVHRGRADQDRPPPRRSADRRSRRLGGAALAQDRARRADRAGRAADGRLVAGLVPVASGEEPAHPGHPLRGGVRRDLPSALRGALSGRSEGDEAAQGRSPRATRPPPGSSPPR